MAWIVEHPDGDVSQHIAMPGTEGIDAGERYAETPRELDLSSEAWDFETGSIVTRFTPAEACAMQWDKVKQYRDEHCYYSTLAVPDVVPGVTLLVQRLQTSRRVIGDQAQAALLATVMGEPYAWHFTDETNESFELNAAQAMSLQAAVTARDDACHLTSQAIRATLNAAVASGASAEEIFEIEILAGFNPEAGE